jgi:hypothetical protein
MSPTIPLYKDLPIRSDSLYRSAWGIFDKDNERDVYGTLNFATTEVVVTARSEIKTGESVVLKYVTPPVMHLSTLSQSQFIISNIQELKYLLIITVFRFIYHMSPPRDGHPWNIKLPHCHGWACAEDEISIYMQASSQWLGMCMFSIILCLQWGFNCWDHQITRPIEIQRCITMECPTKAWARAWNEEIIPLAYNVRFVETHNSIYF